MTTKFNTSLKAPVQTVLDALPKNSHVEGIRWDAETHSVIIEWSHDGIRAPMQYGNEFPLGNLQARTLPEGFRDVDGHFALPEGTEPGANGNGTQGEPAAGTADGPLETPSATGSKSRNAESRKRKPKAVATDGTPTGTDEAN